MSNARTEMYYCLEDPNNYGELLAGAAMQLVNLISENIEEKPETKRSEEGTADLLPGQLKKVGEKSEGSLSFELRPGKQLDDFLQVGMMRAWTNELNITSNAVTFAESDNSISGAALTNIAARTWIRLGRDGMEEGDPNTGDAWVLSKPTATKAILAYLALEDEAPGEDVWIRGKRTWNGVDPYSVMFERKHTDKPTNPFQAIPGFLFNSMQMTFTAKEIVKVEISGMGLWPLDDAALSIANPVAPLGADTGEVLDVSNNLIGFRQNGVLNGNFRQFSFQVQNNYEEIPLGSQTEPDGYSPGVKALTGNFDGYLTDGEQRRDLARKFQDIEIHFGKHTSLADKATYYFTFFKLKSTGGGRSPKENKTGPGMIKCPWESDKPEDSIWMQVCKLTNPSS
jgi:hypothetical protein